MANSEGILVDLGSDSNPLISDENSLEFLNGEIPANENSAEELTMFRELTVEAKQGECNH